MPIAGTEQANCGQVGGSAVSDCELSRLYVFKSTSTLLVAI